MYICERNTIFIKSFFAKFTQNSKSNHKTNICFFRHFFALFTPRIQIIHENVIKIFFFSKMTFLLSQPHHLQVFTRFRLPSIHQPP